MTRNKVLSFLSSKLQKIINRGHAEDIEVIEEIDCFSGGEFTEKLSCAVNNWNQSPKSLFESSLAMLLFVTVVLKIFGFITSSFKDDFASKSFLVDKKPESIQYVERMYLPVFWLFRFAFWMSGAFFYAVYASKSFDGVPASGDVIRQIFLSGFIIAALLLPIVGRSADQFGRMKGTVVTGAAYILGALSTKSSSLLVLMAGRGVGGLGSGLITSIPEAWLASATKETKADPYGRWLSKIFTRAYSLDSIVAICAGQLASYVAGSRGPTGPFEVSPLFIAIAVLMAVTFWKENFASQTNAQGVEVVAKSSIRDGIKMITSDQKILMVGCIQSLFEAAMYIFVMQWAPAMSMVAKSYFGETASVPFGTVFKCFMACCLVGASLYGELAEWAFRTERSSTVMLAIATLSIATAASIVSGNMGLYELVAAFFVFEVCVGMYFPSISYLRSKYIPDSNRSTIMTLFGSASNMMVVSISLSIQKIGVSGAWGVAASAIGLACLCLIRLQIIAKQEAVANLPQVWIRARGKMMALGRIIQIRKLVLDIAQKNDL